MSEQIFLAMGSIYGTRDAPRAWYKHLRETLLAEALVECQLEKSMYYRRRDNKTMMVLLVHVDDLLIALQEGDAKAEELCVGLRKSCS